MTQIKRRAPNPEWVQMYRQGIPTKKIAEAAGVAETTVRYHLAIADQQDPGLRADHRSALHAPTPVTEAGRRHLDEILAFYGAEGRLPVASRSRRESTLAGWLARRREQAAAGTLSPTYAAALNGIPGWREHPTKRDADAAQWKTRLGEVAAWRPAGNDSPRHQKTDDREERTLGVWLHTQRIDCRAGKLTAAKEQQLNEVVRGWREGRVRRGRNSARSGQGVAQTAGLKRG